MGPELTSLAGVPISLGLAEDRLDANLQELVIRPRSYKLTPLGWNID